ncbi:MAG: hypothetical protein KC636_06570, partial [Myxococcales bacterium]|nr:hypothetical protein [Myxococcales bacterium]
MRRVRPTTLLLCLPLALAACDDKAAADASAEAAVDGKAEANAVVGGDAAVNAEVDADASAEVEADVALPEGKIAAATLDLEAIATLLRSAEIKDGAALELAINDGERGIHSVDVDADGDVDYVRVVEARADGEVKLTLEAIPSSKLDVELAVPLATVVLKHDAEAEVVLADLSYTDAVVVEADADVEADLDLKFELDADAEVVAAVEAPVVTWAFEVERPVYEGSFVLVADLDPA